MIPKLGPDEHLKVVDHIEGFTDDDVARMVADAEAGVDSPESLDGTAVVLLKLPQEIRAKILNKARDEDRSIEDVIAAALIKGA